MEFIFIMNLLFAILVAHIIAFGVVLAYMFYRNQAVFKFRTMVANKRGQYNLRHLVTDSEGYQSAFTWAYDTMSPYGQMVTSFRPLKMKYWLTKEQITKLEN